MAKIISKKKRFITTYNSFLNNNFIVDFKDIIDNSSLNNPIINQSNNDTVKIKAAGHPRVSYDEASKSTKKRRCQKLASSYTEDELLQALQLKQRQSGIHSESLDTEVESAHENCSTDKVLAMYLDLRISKGKYYKLKKHIASIYPNTNISTYQQLVKAKKRCYPKHIEISEMGASVEFISY